MTVHVQMATTPGRRSAGGRGRASQVAAGPSGTTATGIEWKEHGISPPLVVQEREGWGRGVFTTKPLKCGVDVFPSLDPLVCVLMSDGVRGRFCDYCFIPAEKSDKSEFLNKKMSHTIKKYPFRLLRRCTRCNFVSYCSKNCQVRTVNNSVIPYSTYISRVFNFTNFTNMELFTK